jgi:RNA polymerase-binding transcription factor DksA
MTLHLARRLHRSWLGGAFAASHVVEDDTMAHESPPSDALSEKADQVERLREFIDETSFSGDEREVSGELSSADQHPADVADVVEQRARDYSIREILDGDAEQIRHAQQRQADGQYGICEDCGQSIDPARLSARPEATTCVNCQRQRETTG